MKPRFQLSEILNNLIVGLLSLLLGTVFVAHFRHETLSEYMLAVSTPHYGILVGIVAFVAGFMLSELFDSFLKQARTDGPRGQAFRLLFRYVFGMKGRPFDHTVRAVTDCIANPKNPINALFITKVEKVFGLKTSDLTSLDSNEIRRLCELIYVYMRQHGKPAGIEFHQWHGVFGSFQGRLAFLSFWTFVFSTLSLALHVFAVRGTYDWSILISTAVVAYASTYYNGLNFENIRSHQGRIAVHTFIVVGPNPSLKRTTTGKPVAAA